MADTPFFILILFLPQLTYQHYWKRYKLLLVVSLTGDTM